MKIGSRHQRCAAVVACLLLSACLGSATPLLPGGDYVVEARIDPGDYMACKVNRKAGEADRAGQCSPASMTRDSGVNVMRTATSVGDTEPEIRRFQMFVPRAGAVVGLLQTREDDGSYVYARGDWRAPGKFAMLRQACGAIPADNDGLGLYQRVKKSIGVYCMFTDPNALARVALDSGLWRHAEATVYLAARTRPWRALAAPPLFNPVRVASGDIAYGPGREADRRIQLLSIAGAVALGIEMDRTRRGGWAHMMAWSRSDRRPIGVLKLIRLRALRPGAAALSFPTPSAALQEEICGDNRENCGSLPAMIARHGEGGEILIQGTTLNLFPSGNVSEGRKIVTIVARAGDYANGSMRSFVTDPATGLTTFD